MRISREVIIDLLPLYLAGEASAASRALVDEYLETDPDLRAKVKSGELDSVLAASPATPAPQVGMEVRALQRTRGLLAWQRRLYAMAIAFTLLPLSTVFWTEGGHFRHRFVFEGQGGAIGGLLSLAFWCWLGYWLLRRRLRTTAL